jgi:predicted GNAT superfamily acetyltransferase
MATTTPGDVRAKAASVARAAAADAGVEIHLLDSVPEFQAASRLIATIWNDGEDAEEKAPVAMLRALSHAGNFVGGAFRGDELVGVSIGFFGRDAESMHVHSHITGIDSRHQNKSLGFALKQFQRAWALAQGADRIQWTADPLVRRNLHFNLMKLGATVVDYYPDFYGSILDGVNGDGESDRVLINWDLASFRALRAADGLTLESPLDEAAATILRPDEDGNPVLEPVDAAALRVWVPEDIVEMRQEDPARAHAWRESLRAAVGGCLGKGYRAEAITRDGWYMLTR